MFNVLGPHCGEETVTLIVLAVLAVALVCLVVVVAGSMVLVGLLEQRHREMERDVSPH